MTEESQMANMRHIQLYGHQTPVSNNSKVKDSGKKIICL